MKNKKHIVILLENFFYPQDTRVLSEARSLVNADYKVSVICPSAPSQPKFELMNNVQVYRYANPKTWNNALSYIWEYTYSMLCMLFTSLKILFTQGFDALHACNPPDILIILGIFYKFFGKKFVFDHHDLSPELFNIRFDGKQHTTLIFKILVLFEKLSCRISDHVIATNESYKKIEMSRSGISESRITIVRNGPDNIFMNVVVPDMELRKKAKMILGYIGEIGFQDGVDNLIRAVKSLIVDYKKTNILCVIIGSGAALQSIKDLAKELGIEQNLVFTGWISGEQLVRLLASTDICIVPDPCDYSIDTNTLAKVAEYMALSKPIVAFDSYEQRFTAGEAALFATPNDLQDFTKKIAELIDDPEKREKLGKIGRKRVDTEFAWSYQARKLIEVYDTLFN